MRISDYIEQACANLWKKKLRTFLTTSGVVIGIGALVCMFAFGQGIQRNITEQFNKVDLLNNIVVSAPPRAARPPSLDPDDPDDADSRDEPAAPADANDPRHSQAGCSIPGGGTEDRGGRGGFSGVAFPGPDSPW